MFTMMTNARLGVGGQGVGAARVGLAADRHRVLRRGLGAGAEGQRIAARGVGRGDGVGTDRDGGARADRRRVRARADRDGL